MPGVNLNVLQVDPDRKSPYSDTEYGEIEALIEQAPAGMRSMCRECLDAGILRIENRDLGAELISLHSMSADVRTDVIRALGNLAHSRFKPQLIAAMEDPDPDVRGEASLYVKDYDDSEVKAVLLKALKTDPDSWVRTQTIFGLAQNFTGEDVEEALLEAMDDEDEDVASYAASFLERKQDGQLESEGNPMDPSELRRYFKGLQTDAPRFKGVA